MSLPQILYEKRKSSSKENTIILTLAILIVALPALTINPDTITAIVPDIFTNDNKPDLEEYTVNVAKSSIMIPRHFVLANDGDQISVKDGFSLVVTRANGLIDGQMSDGKGGIVSYYKIPNGATLYRTTT